MELNGRAVAIRGRDPSPREPLPPESQQAQKTRRSPRRKVEPLCLPSDGRPNSVTDGGGLRLGVCLYQGCRLARPCVNATGNVQMHHVPMPECRQLPQASRSRREGGRRAREGRRGVCSAWPARLAWLGPAQASSARRRPHGSHGSGFGGVRIDGAVFCKPRGRGPQGPVAP